VVVPPSRLKELRRDVCGRLAAAVRTARDQRRQDHLAAARADLLSASPVRQVARQELTVLIPGPRDAQLLADPAVDRLLIPLTPGNLRELERLGRRLSGRQDRIVWDLPLVILDEQWAGFREAVRTLAGRGFSCFRLNNLGQFELFSGLPEVRLTTGYRLFSLNSQALQAWQDLGAAEATLYIEDDRDNLGELLRRHVGLDTALTVYGPIPLITSRIPVKGLRGDQPVVSDRGDGYRVDQRSGLTVLSAETDFSLLGHLAELRGMGCGRIVVDLSHLGPFSPRGGQVLEACKAGRDLAGTSPFNFLAGLE
jgi:putative protease